MLAKTQVTAYSYTAAPHIFTIYPQSIVIEDCADLAGHQVRSDEV